MKTVVDEGRQEAKADSKNDEGRQEARVDKKKKSSEPSKAMSFTQPGSVIKGFSAPQFDAQGNLVGRIHSERAIVQPDGRYRVEGIHDDYEDDLPQFALVALDKRHSVVIRLDDLDVTQSALKAYELDRLVGNFV